MRPKIVVLGGTGFVGRHLAARLAHFPDLDAVFVVHRQRPDWQIGAGLSFFDCPLTDTARLNSLLAEASHVINLLRPDGSGERLATLSAIAESLASSSLKRYIHASSIDVYGEADGMVLSEATAPLPGTVG